MAIFFHEFAYSASAIHVIYERRSIFAGNFDFKAAVETGKLKTSLFHHPISRKNH